MAKTRSCTGFQTVDKVLAERLGLLSNKVSAKNGLIAMLREPFSQQYPFETITLDELVPEDHLVGPAGAFEQNLTVLPFR